MNIIRIDIKKKDKRRIWLISTFREFRPIKTCLDDLNDQGKLYGHKKVTKEMLKSHDADSDSGSDFNSDIELADQMEKLKV